MKQYVVTALFCLSALGLQAQGMYGFQAGVGRTTAYKSYTSPTVSGFYLADIIPHLYAGGELRVERYSFNASFNPPSPSNGDAISARQKSTFIFFSPKASVGLGSRKMVHLNFCLGPGVFMGGSKLTSQYETFISPAGANAADTNIADNSYNIRNIIFRVGFGVMERIPISYFWDLVLSQDLSYITSHLNYPGNNLQTHFFSLSVGLLHRYPVEMIED